MRVSCRGRCDSQRRWTRCLRSSSTVLILEPFTLTRQRVLQRHWQHQCLFLLRWCRRLSRHAPGAGDAGVSLGRLRATWRPSLAALLSIIYDLWAELANLIE